MRAAPPRAIANQRANGRDPSRERHEPIFLSLANEFPRGATDLAPLPVNGDAAGPPFDPRGLFSGARSSPAKHNKRPSKVRFKAGRD